MRTLYQTILGVFFLMLCYSSVSAQEHGDIQELTRYDFIVNGVYYKYNGYGVGGNVRVTYKIETQFFDEDTSWETIKTYSDYKGNISIPSQVYDPWGNICNVTEVDSRAFAGCTELQSVTFLSNSHVISIGVDAFNGCSSLTSITFQGSLNSIAWGAFSGCAALERLNLPEGLTYIGPNAFYGCSSLTNTILPSTVTRIGDMAFYGCTGQLQVNCDLPDAGTTYDDYWDVTNQDKPFKNAKFRPVVFGNNVKRVGNYAFAGSEVSSLALSSSSITEIGDYAFSDCKSVTKISLPSTLTTIGMYAFKGTTNVTSINIPKSVTSMKSNALYGMKDIFLEGRMTLSDVSDSFAPKTAKIHVDAGRYQYYLNLLPGYIIVDDVVHTVFFETAEITAPSRTNISLPMPSTPSAQCAPALRWYLHPANNANWELKDDLTFYTGSNIGSAYITVYSLYDDEVWANLKVNIVPNPDVKVDSIVWSSYNSYHQIADDAKEYAITCYVRPYDAGNRKIEWTSSDENIVSVVSRQTDVNTSNYTSTYLKFNSFGHCTLTARALDGSNTSNTHELYVDAKGVCIDGINYNLSYDGMVAHLAPFYSGMDSAPYEDKWNKNQKYSGILDIPSQVSYDGEDFIVSGIDDGACYNCTSLSSVNIPSTVSSIGVLAFYGCSSLSTVTNEALMPQNIAVNTFPTHSLTLRVLPEAKSAFEAAEYWQSFTCIEEIAVEPERSYDVVVTGENGQTTSYTFSDGVIPSSQFVSNTDIVSVEIGDGIVEIGSHAFDGCSNIKSIHIPESVTTISEGAFCACYALQEINIPSKVTRIEASTFQGCAITSITIPEGVTFVGEMAFYDCSSLKTVNLPSSLTDFSEDCIFRCRSLSAINVASDNPNYCSVDGALYSKDMSVLFKFPAIKEGDYIIPSTITRIGKAAFSHSKLQSIVIPENVVMMGGYAFFGCRDLTSVTISASLTNIPHFAFAECISMESIVLPDGLKTISEQVFWSATSLKSISIPASVQSIGDDAFTGTGLTRITCTASLPPVCSVLMEESRISDVEVFVPFASIDSYKTADCWNSFAKIRSIEATAIATFYVGATEYHTIEVPVGQPIALPANPTKQEYTFMGWEGMPTDGVMPPDGVRAYATFEWNYGFFDGPYKYTYINKEEKTVSYSNNDHDYQWDNEIPEHLIVPSTVSYNGVTYKVVTVAANAFTNNGTIKHVTISSGITKVEGEAFYCCRGLEEVDIPASVTGMDGAFSLCLNLRSIQVDANNPNYTSIDGVLFSKDKTRLILYPANKTSGEYAIPDGVTSIEYGAFIGLNEHSPSRIILPQGMQTIGSGAFFSSYGTDLLQEIVVPGSISQIEENAFGGSLHLSRLTMYALNPPACHAQAFDTYDSYDAKESVTVHVPHKALAAYQAAPIWQDFKYLVGDLYSISYMVDGKSYCEEIHPAGDLLTLPAAPEKEGYIFKGWEGLPANMLMTEGDITPSAIFEIVIDDDLEYTDIATLSDAVYVTNQEGRIGSQLVLPIQMKNSIAATGFQADLVLPEGITVAEDEEGFPMVELSTQRTTLVKTNIFDYEYMEDGSLRILANSTKGIAFTGNDGEVCLVTLDIAEGLEEGNYPIVLKNVVVTDALGTNKKKVDFVKSNLALIAYTLGDANGDDEVDVADISSISAYVLGREVSGFVEKAADVNNDQEVDVADMSSLAYLILHPETSFKAKARKVAEKKELAENADNTLYAEMLQAEASTDVVLPIMMRNSIETTGFQLDLMLPEGVTLKDAALSTARTTSKRTNLFDYARQADGSYRILCNSTKGLSFNGYDGEVMLITLHIDKDAELGAQTIALKDMVLTDATGMLRDESSLSESTLWIGNATGIHEMAGEKNAPAYDLQGRQVSKKQKGIVISDGKKTVVE